MALEIVHEHDLGVYTSKEEHPVLALVPANDSTYASVLFLQKWASRPKQGSSLGRNSTTRYAREVEIFSFYVRIRVEGK